MEARAKFLASAARHYATSSPSTSAHLMLQRIELEDLDPKPKRKDDPISCCRACGTILVPGWTSRKSMNTGRKSRKATKATATERSEKANSKIVPATSIMEEECLACRRVIRTSIPKKPRLRPTHGLLSEQSGATAGVEAVGENPRSTQGRNRKRRLKGLLTKSKEEEEARAASTPGFDLMDLMRAT